MMKKRINIWDIIAWIVLIGILLWLLLKVFGIINSPELVTYAPYFGAVYLAGWAMHKLETVAKDINNLNKFKDETIRQINEIKTNCVNNHFRK